ncbi:hypothetical protein OH807_33580 [Kitasatospora sp. NBC_01560]|uniref:hypothetical protein n=1 Tax=unclassified Kitasatospora TaxID=2633591 RepID=UPI002E13A70E|nr:hypothetical protein OG294_09090 [Kitasatospora sp. NBC_01302]
MARDEQLGGVVIGPREIYDQLVGVREDVRSLAQSSATVDQMLKDHEDRVRALERWRYGVVASGLAGGTALAADVVARLKG